MKIEKESKRVIYLWKHMRTEYTLQNITWFCDGLVDLCYSYINTYTDFCYGTQLGFQCLPSVVSRWIYCLSSSSVCHKRVYRGSEKWSSLTNGIKYNHVFTSTCIPFYECISFYFVYDWKDRGTATRTLVFTLVDF